MRLVEYSSRDALMAGLAGVIASQLRAELETGPVTLAVPGGTTPGPVFDALSLLDIDWARVSVVLTDERWVPETNARSNTKLVRERLLVNRAAAAHLLPLHLPRIANPDDALEALEAGLLPHLPLTICLLGMGVDLHIASLFPGADRLAEAMSADAPMVMALRAEAAGEPRLTLTAPVLAAAKHTHVLITGADKRAVLGRARQFHVSEAPVLVVLDTATVHWAE